MKDYCTANSTPHLYISLQKVRECAFWTWEWKGFNDKNTFVYIWITAISLAMRICGGHVCPSFEWTRLFRSRLTQRDNKYALAIQICGVKNLLFLICHETPRKLRASSPGANEDCRVGGTTVEIRALPFEPETRNRRVTVWTFLETSQCLFSSCSWKLRPTSGGNGQVPRLQEETEPVSSASGWCHLATAVLVCQRTASWPANWWTEGRDVEESEKRVRTGVWIWNKKRHHN